MNFFNSLKSKDTQELDEEDERATEEMLVEKDDRVRFPNAAEMLARRGIEVRPSFARYCDMGHLELICPAIVVEVTPLRGTATASYTAASRLRTHDPPLARFCGGAHSTRIRILNT